MDNPCDITHLGHHPFDDTQRDEIRRNVDGLSDFDKAAFYRLANVFQDAKGGKSEGKRNRSFNKHEILM